MATSEMTKEEAVRAAHELAEAARLNAEAAQQSAESARIAAENAQVAADQASALAEGFGAVLGVDPFIFRLTIFVLAIFVGYYVVWSVTPALHTPLMSVTNAISSVIVVGALLAVAVEIPDINTGGAWTAKLLGFIALVFASVNIFGGFLVTQRMLAMYKKKER